MSSLKTNFTVSPYFDNHDPSKNYHKVLFKPGVSVQNKELHQIQDYSQEQVERFADNILKKGTIVEGCNFTFHNNYPFVKILDNDIFGAPATPNNYVGLFAKNSANLIAHVINSVDGYETNAPDLNTLYLNYVNSGNTGNLTSFTVGETITIYDSNNSIYSVSVNAGAVGFSNNDTVIDTPTVLVNMSLGTFANGDYITQPDTGANLQIVTADYTTFANTSRVLLYVKPRNADLANASVNSTSWTLGLYANISNPGNTVAGQIEAVYGQGFAASIVTNGIGKVLNIIPTSQGYGFNYLPFVGIRSANNLSGINALNLVPKNYVTSISIDANSTSVGNGYAFSVGDGIIYQKGYLVNVQNQITIVSKYTNSPNNVSAGFTTDEYIITSNEDDALFDNATDTKNLTAPGADRLRLVPRLVVTDTVTAHANTDFAALVEWSEGNPYKQNQTTQYSRIGTEMAQQVFDTSGNFVVDTFQVATASTANAANEGSIYTVVVDPGQAYINGYKVQTLRNFYIDVPKGLSTKVSNNFISLSYGNYVLINEVGGLFQFNSAANVDIYDTNKTFISNTTTLIANDITPAGTKIGTSQIRSLVLDSGTPGDASAVYRLYLFNIQMNAGKNFEAARGIYYNGTNKGIADVVLTSSPTSNVNIAFLQGKTTDSLIFPAGCESLKNSSNTRYTYRTIDQTTAFGNNGIMVKSIAASPNEFYPYTGILSSSQMKELFVTPLGNTMTQYTAMVGTASVNATSNLVIGTGTNFYSDFAAGDFVKAIANATTSQIKKVTGVVNAVALQVDSVFSFGNTACTFKRVFPRNAPIPFGQRAGLTANVDSNGNILTLGLYHSNALAITLEGTTSVNNSIAVNIQRRNITSSSKTANRSKFIKIACSNNVATSIGPWSVGVPDALRLRAVYMGDATVNTASLNVTKDFYLDNNQTTDFLDLGYLFIKPRSRSSSYLASNTYMLVQFDYLTRGSEGYFDTVSYLNTANTAQIAVLDATPLANLTSSVPSLEVPEMYTTKGKYYDMLNNFDFRPAVAVTATPTTDPTIAPINPSQTVSFGNTADPTNEKKFPLPDSAMETTVEQYMGRTDSVFISGEKGNIYVLQGISDVDPRRRYPPNHPKDSLKLQTISVPAYPNISDNISSAVGDLLATGIANERSSNQRLKTHVTALLLSSYEFQLSQPMVYTMEDIAELERRVKDLEYYVSLSILETNITNKIIPSSVDKTLNRFKFGFFADDFSTEVYSDLQNPQYAASIESEGITSWGISKSPTETNKGWADADKVSPDSKLLSPSKLIQKATNRIVPPKFIWSIHHHVDNLPWIDETIIQQPYATEPVLIVATTPTSTPTTPPVTDRCVPKTITETIPSSNGYIATSGSKKKSLTLTLGNKSGPVTIYFSNKNVAINMIVYKNGVAVKSTNLSDNAVVVCTATDKAFLGNEALKSGFSFTTNVNYTRVASDYVKNAGKITFNHNPATGLTYNLNIAVLSGKNYQVLVEYPLTAQAKKQTIIDPCVIVNTVTSLVTTPPRPLGYTGTLQILDNNGWSCSKQFAINGKRLSAIVLIATGLKPNTKHKVYLDGQEVSAYVGSISAIVTGGAFQILAPDAWAQWTQIMQPGIAALGHGIVTNPEGKVEFILAMPIALSGWLAQVVANGAKTSFGSSGYSTFVLQAPNSVATRLIARRGTTSSLPATPAGNP